MNSLIFKEDFKKLVTTLYGKEHFSTSLRKDPSLLQILNILFSISIQLQSAPNWVTHFSIPSKSIKLLAESYVSLTSPHLKIKQLLASFILPLIHGAQSQVQPKILLIPKHCLVASGKPWPSLWPISVLPTSFHSTVSVILNSWLLNWINPSTLSIHVENPIHPVGEQRDVIEDFKSRELEKNLPSGKWIVWLRVR